MKHTDSYFDRLMTSGKNKEIYYLNDGIENCKVQIRLYDIYIYIYIYILIHFIDILVPTISNRRVGRLRFETSF